VLVLRQGIQVLKMSFELDGQRAASIEIYLKYTEVRGLPHSSDPDTQMKGELWTGVAPSW